MTLVGAGGITRDGGFENDVPLSAVGVFGGGICTGVRTSSGFVLCVLLRCSISVIGTDFGVLAVTVDCKKNLKFE